MVRGGSIIFKKQGIKLKGDALGAYAGKLGPRQSLPPLHFGQTRSPKCSDLNLLPHLRHLRSFGSGGRSGSGLSLDMDSRLMFCFSINIRLYRFPASPKPIPPPP